MSATDAAAEGTTEDREGAGLSYGLITGEQSPAEPEAVMLRVDPVDDGLQLLITERGSHHPIHAETVGRSFFSDRTNRGRVGNIIKRRVEAADGEEVKDMFVRVCTGIDTRFDELDEELRSPAVSDILSSTVSVQKFRSDPATVTIAFEKNGRRAEIEFDEHDYRHGAPTRLCDRFWGEFDEDYTLGDGEWEQLKSSWEDMVEILGGESHTEADETVQRVVTSLSSHANVVADVDALGNSTYAAWYETDSEVADGDDVLWIKSGAVSEQLEEAGKNTGWMGPLSKRLQASGYTFDGSHKKRPHGRVYPFDPDALGHSRDSIPDGDDDLEVQP